MAKFHKTRTGSVPAKFARQAVDELSCYTLNRNLAVEESAFEAEKYPGWYVARSRDGVVPHAYGRSISELGNRLAELGLQFSDVVVETIPAAYNESAICGEETDQG